MTGAGAPDREDVLAAARRLAGQVVRTPVVRCPALDELAGAELWLKAENLQLVGAFKARGALNSLALLDPEVRARYETFSLVPTGTTPEQLKAIQKAAADLWTPVIKASGFQAD